MNNPAARRLARRIRRACWQRGWNRSEFAQRSGVSRTTLYLLERGKIAQPRGSTLKRIADALEMGVAELVDGPQPTAISPAIKFDRATNGCVREVSEECPQLFSGWSASQWDELYSSFGVGGQLTPQGVVQAAIAINRKSEAAHQLNVILETHLRDVAISLIESLFQQLKPHAPVVPTADFTDRSEPLEMFSFPQAEATEM